MSSFRSAIVKVVLPYDKYGSATLQMASTRFWRDSRSTTKLSKTAALFSRLRPFASAPNCNDFAGRQREARESGVFEHLDDVIPDANGIEKTFEIESALLKVGHPKIV